MYVGNYLRISKKEYHYSPWFPIKQGEEMGFHPHPKTLKVIHEALAEQWRKELQSCVFFKEASDSDP